MPQCHLDSRDEMWLTSASVAAELFPQSKCHSTQDGQLHVRFAYTDEAPIDLSGYGATWRATLAKNMVAKFELCFSCS